MEDRALVELSLTGRKDAFAELVRRHHALVESVVRRAGGAGDTGDLVQEVFLDAWAGLASLEHPERLRGWLVRLAQNRRAALGRRRQVEERGLPRVARQASAAESDRLVRLEDRERLRTALDELPPEARAVVSLRYLEGLQAPEIAAELGISPEAVRQRLSRALRALRERLAR